MQTAIVATNEGQRDFEALAKRFKKADKSCRYVRTFVGFNFLETDLVHKVIV